MTYILVGIFLISRIDSKDLAVNSALSLFGNLKAVPGRRMTWFQWWGLGGVTLVE
jgi:hypothetical protein